MSQTVIGYRDGRRIVRDDGPARARVSGYGGSAIGHTITVVLTHAQRKAKGTADRVAAGKGTV